MFITEISNQSYFDRSGLKNATCFCVSHDCMNIDSFTCNSSFDQIRPFRYPVYQIGIMLYIFSRNRNVTAYSEIKEVLNAICACGIRNSKQFVL